MIPFIREFDFAYGAPMQVSPLLRRVVARNPGRFTGPGTGTLIVGRETLAIVDPGPDLDEHIGALERAIADRPVGCVLVTHNHVDHSALARRLADRVGAPLCGRSGGVAASDGGAMREEASDDAGFRPDIELEDGMRFYGADWTLLALHTPGHTSEHFCFALEEERTLLCGDHVMGWSTSIVSPPDGHMGQYVASLQLIRAMRFARLAPTHGPSIENPHAFLGAYIAHRQQRRAAVLDRVRRGDSTVRQLVDALYRDVAPGLRAAAALSVWAHLIQLVEEGELNEISGCGLNACYGPARSNYAVNESLAGN